MLSYVIKCLLYSSSYYFSSNGRYIDYSSLTYATRVVLKVVIIVRERSQPSIIFVLASQYRSHSVPLANAAQCPRWFLSMSWRRLHSMQRESGRIPMRWCVPEQSCWTHKRNCATAFLLRQCGVLAISRLHGCWDSFVYSSCLYALWNTCFRWSLIEWYDVSLVCVCKLFAPFLASASACSFPAIWQCPGIHCSAICLCLTLSGCIRAWQSLALPVSQCPLIPLIEVQPLSQKDNFSLKFVLVHVQQPLCSAYGFSFSIIGGRVLRKILA
jgi:hypothetical protein